ncbi:MAG TPA: hypothetical protein VI821_00650 [Candidatus Paceibacterota bacterium]
MSDVGYCSVGVFLETEHPALYKLLDHYCLSNISPRRSGVTFLLPDKASVKELEKLRDAKKDNKLNKILRSLIIPLYFEKISDLMSGPVTALDGIKLIPDNKSANKIAGVKISENKNFIPLEGRGSMQIFDIDGLPEFSESSETMSKPVKKGGNEAGKLDEIILDIEKYAIKVGGQEPFAKYVVTLAELFRNKSHDDFESVIALMDYNPMVTFYILMASKEVFSAKDALIEARYAVDIVNHAGAKYKGLLNEAQRIDKSARNEIRKRLSEIRKQALAKDSFSHDNIVKVVNNVYDNPSGTVGKSYDQIFSSKVASYFGRNKKYVDEFRNLAHHVIQQAGSMKECVEYVHDLYVSSINKALVLFGSQEKSFQVRELTFGMCQFLCSTEFFYLPCPMNEAAEIVGAKSFDASTPKTLCFVNSYEFPQFEEHESTINSEIINVLIT